MPQHALTEATFCKQLLVICDLYVFIDIGIILSGAGFDVGGCHGTQWLKLHESDGAKMMQPRWLAVLPAAVRCLEKLACGQTVSVRKMRKPVCGRVSGNGLQDCFSIWTLYKNEFTLSLYS